MTNITVTQQVFLELMAGKIRSAYTEVDWTDFWDIAEAHEMTGQMYTLLQKNALLSYLPAQDNLTLKQKVLMDKLVLHAQLLEYQNMMKIVCEHGYHPVAIKGVALANTIFHAGPSETIRCFNDFDILVTPDECENVYYLLQQYGYRPEKQRDAADVTLFKSAVQHLPSLMKDDFFCIEVHHKFTQMFSPYSFDVQGIIARRKLVPEISDSFYIADNEDSFLLLCYNLYKSDVEAPNTSLKLHYDLLNFIKLTPLNHSVIIKRTLQGNLEFPIYYALYRINELFQEYGALADFPLHKFDSIRPSTFSIEKDKILEFHTLSADPIGYWPEDYASRLFWPPEKRRLMFFEKFYEYCEQKNFKKICEDLNIPYRTIGL